MTVRAKMQCHSITDFGNAVQIKMGAVYSSDPNSENRAFSDATPSGSVEMMIQSDKPAAKMFKVKAYYYVDFEEAPAA